MQDEQDTDNELLVDSTRSGDVSGVLGALSSLIITLEGLKADAFVWDRCWLVWGELQAIGCSCLRRVKTKLE